MRKPGHVPTVSLLIMALVVVALFFFALDGGLTGRVVLDPNQTYVVTASVTLDADVYAYTLSGDEAAIVIASPNLILDCSGATLAGSGDGIGILNSEYTNVTIKNCFVQGFAHGLKSAPGLTNYQESTFVGNLVQNVREQSPDSQNRSFTPLPPQKPANGTNEILPIILPIEEPQQGVKPPASVSFFPVTSTPADTTLRMDAIDDSVENGYGKITFSSDTSLADINECVILGKNLVGIKDTDRCSEFHKPANLEIRGLSFLHTPLIKKSDALCLPPDCNITSYTGGVLTFVVRSFTNYTAASNSQMRIFDDNDNQTNNKGVNILINFTANYTKLADNAPIDPTTFNSNCTIVFNVSPSIGQGPYNMSYSTSRNMFFFNVSFNTSASVRWNVTCAGNGFDTLNGTDDLLVTPHCGDQISQSTVLLDHVRNDTNGTICPASGLNISNTTSASATLDCAGFHINGTGGTDRVGVVINASHVTVRNCNIFNFSSLTNLEGSIAAQSVSNISIINNALFVRTGSANGINILSSSGVRIENNTIMMLSSSANGIRLRSSSNVTVTGNQINTYGSAEDGIKADSGTQNNFTISYNRINITVNSADRDGIDFTSVGNSSIFGNLINVTGGKGINLTVGTNLTVRDNVIFPRALGSPSAITVGNSIQFLDIINNTIVDAQQGITVSASVGTDATFVRIINNTINVTSASTAITLSTGVLNTTIEGNLINVTTAAAISCSSAVGGIKNLTIVNNTIFGSSTPAGINFAGCQFGYFDGNIVNTTNFPFEFTEASSSPTRDDFNHNVMETNVDRNGKKTIYAFGGNRTIRERNGGQLLIFEARNVTIEQSLFANASNVVVRNSVNVIFNNSNFTTNQSDVSSSYVQFFAFDNVNDSLIQNSRITIENVEVPLTSNAVFGIAASTVRDFSIRNNTILQKAQSSSAGIRIRTSTKVNITDNEITSKTSSNSNVGILADLGAQNLLLVGRNQINTSGSLSFGISFTSVQNSTIFENAINTTSADVVRLATVTNVTVIRNQLFTLSEGSIRDVAVLGGSLVDIINNTLVGKNQGMQIGDSDFGISRFVRVINNTLNLSGDQRGLDLNGRNITVEGNLINLSGTTVSAAISCSGGGATGNFSILNNTILRTVGTPSSSTAAAINFNRCPSNFFDGNIINDTLFAFEFQGTTREDFDQNITDTNKDARGLATIYVSGENRTIQNVRGGQLLMFFATNITVRDSVFENASNVVVDRSLNILFNNSNFSSDLQDTASNYRQFIDVRNTNNTVFENVRVVTNGTTDSGFSAAIIFVSPNSNVTLRKVNITTHGTIDQALYFEETRNVTILNSYIESNTSDSSGTAIVVSGSSLRPENILVNNSDLVCTESTCGLVSVACGRNMQVLHSRLRRLGTSTSGATMHFGDSSCTGGNHTLQNLNISTHSTAIDLDVDTSNITDLYIQGARIGIDLAGSRTRINNITIIGGGKASDTPVVIGSNFNSISNLHITDNASSGSSSGLVHINGQANNLTNITIVMAGVSSVPALSLGHTVVPADNTTIQNLTITNLNHPSSIGIVFSSSGARNSRIERVRIEGSSGTGVYLASGASVAVDNNLTDIEIHLNGTGIEFTSTINRTVFRNVLLNVSGNGSLDDITTQSIFIPSGSMVLAEFVNMTIVSPRITVNNVGINWTFKNITFDDVNASVLVEGFNISGRRDVEVHKYLNLTIFNRAYINSSNLTFLNVSANITFKNIPASAGVPAVLVSFAKKNIHQTNEYQVCPSNVCTSVLAGPAPNTVLVNVNHFTVYALNISEPPTQGVPVLNSTNGSNLTTENITVYNQSTADFNSDQVKNIVNWNLNGTSVLVANLPFEGGSNATFTQDYAPFTHNRTLYNVRWNSSGGFDGKGAYEFNGTGFIDVNNESLFRFDKNFTLEFWAKPVGRTSFSSLGVIVNKPRSPSASYGIMWNDASDRFEYFVTGTTIVGNSSGAYRNNWSHVVGVYNGSMALYVNGELQVTGTPGTILYADTAPLRIGKYEPTNDGTFPYYFNGSIDEVRIWNRSLSAPQVLALSMNRTNTIVSSELVIGNVWNASMTPNDGSSDGATLSSNRLVIRTPAQAPVACGDTLLASRNLSSNLSCSGTALSIGAHNVNLNCLGFVITGNGNGDGINNTGFDAVTIKNCVIENFNIGIRWNGSDNGTLDNNTIRSVLSSGLLFNGSTGNQLSNMTISTARNQTTTPGSGYTISQTTFSLTSFSGTTVTLADDDVSSEIVMPFNFTFFGNANHSVFIGSNGFITFLSGQDHGCCIDKAIPSATSPNGFVAAHWADLDPGSGGTIARGSTGSSPNRVFLVNFSAVPHFGGTDPVSFQIKLFETSNKIEIHCTTCPSSAGVAHTQGIENRTGTAAAGNASRNSSTSYSLTNDAIALTPAAGSSNPSGATGIILDSKSSNNTFVDTNIVVSNTGPAIRALSSSGNNTFRGTTVNTNATWLSSDASSAGFNFTDTLFDAANGSVRIIATFGIPQSAVVNQSNLNILFNKVFLNSTNATFLNKSAQITLRNITVSDPQPLVDLNDDGIFEACSSALCSEVSFSNNIFVFNVSHFTAYSSNATPQGETAPPNVTIFVNDTLLELGVEAVRVDWNATDQNLQSREANVSFPNGTLLQRLTNDTIDFNLTPANLSVIGNYSVRAFAVDTSGNSNLTTASFRIVDTTVPTVSLLQPANGTFVNVATFNLTCNASDAQLKNMSVFHNITGTFTLNQSNNITGTINTTNFTLTNIPETNFIWNCLAFDQSNNSAFSASNFSAVVDTVRPNVTILINDSSLEFGADSVRVDWNASDPNLQFKEANVSFPNGTLLQRLTNDSVDFIFTPSNLSVTGTYVLQVFANNSAGNKNLTTGSFVVVDSTVPVVALITPANATFINTAAFNLTCNASNLQLRNLSVFHNLSGSFKLNKSVNILGTTNQSNFTINDAPNVFFVWNCLAFDQSNNSAFAVSNLSATVDTVRPNVTISLNDTTLEFGIEAITIDWNASDINLQFTEANVSFPNGTLLQRLTNNSQNFIFTPSNLSASGVYVVRVFANDSAGNTNISIASFNVTDTTPPVVALVAPQNKTFLPVTTFNLSCNASDQQLKNSSLFHNVSGSFVRNQSLNVNGTAFVANFTISNTPETLFVWNCLVFDQSNNSAFALQNFTAIVDVTEPLVAIFINDSRVVRTIEDVRVDWNVSDTHVQFMEANVTFPNGTLLQRLINDTIDFNFTAINLSSLGQYSVRVFANDSAANKNVIVKTFRVVDPGTPEVTLLTPVDNGASFNTSRTFKCSATVELATLANISLFADFGGAFSLKDTANVSGTSNESTFTLTGIPPSTFHWNCLAVSSMNASDFALSNGTFTILENPAAVGGGGGGGGGGSISTRVILPVDSQEQQFSANTNQYITILYKGVEYVYRVTLLTQTASVLRSSSTHEASLLTQGVTVQFDLDLDGLSDVDVIYKGFEGTVGVFTLNLHKKVLLPKVIPPIPQPPPAVIVQTVPEDLPLVSPPTPRAPPVVPVEEIPQPAPPSRPITVWTWIVGFSLAALLVGSVAIFRYRRAVLERPPQVTKELPSQVFERVQQKMMEAPRAEEKKPLEEVSQRKDELAVLQPEKPKSTKLQSAELQITEEVVQKSIEEKRQELDAFLSTVIAKRISEQRVRAILLQRGWPEDLVEQGFERVRGVAKTFNTPVYKMSELEYQRMMRVVQRLLKRGLSKDQIAQSLQKKGWKQKTINELLKDIR